MPVKTQSDSRGPSYYIGSALAILIMLFFGKLVPAWGSVTPVGVSCLGIFIGVVIAVIFTGETLWPSMVALCSLALNGYFTSINTAISSIFGAPVVYGFFLITAIINAMNEVGTGESIASMLLTRKFFQKKPLLLSYCFLMAFAIATNFMNTVGTLVLGYPILQALLDYAEVKSDEKYAKFMNLGFFLAVATGWCFRSAIMPDFAFRFEFFDVALAGTGYKVNLLVYTIYEVIVVFVFFALYVLAMKYVFKCGFGKLAATNFRDMPELMNKAKLNKYQVIFLLGFVVFAVSALIPSSWTLLQQVGQYGVLGIVCVILSFIKRRDENGNKVRLFDFNKSLKSVSWEIAMALGLFACLGTAIASDACGIKQWMQDSVGSFLAQSGSVSLVLVVLVGCAAITHVFNNSATMTIFAALTAPICVPFVVSGSINPSLLIACIHLGAQSGFLTMAASSTAPIMHKRPGIDNKFMWTGGLFMEALFIVVELLVFFVLNLIL